MKQLINKVKMFFVSVFSKKQDNTDDELVSKFQILAGIKPHNREKGINDLLNITSTPNQNNNTYEKVVIGDDYALKLSRSKEELAKQRKEELAIIDFYSLPLDRVSNETRLKIAELVKEDILRQASSLPERFSVAFSPNSINDVLQFAKPSNPNKEHLSKKELVIKDEFIKSLIEEAKDISECPELVEEIRSRQKVAKSKNK
jgi:hypothetical protein